MPTNTEKPNCYKCIHRGNVAGSAHSSCHHPSIGKINPLLELCALMGGGAMPPMKNTIGVTGNPHGIRHGWFAWPLNFDPTWLETCQGFEEKKEEPCQPKRI